MILLRRRLMWYMRVLRMQMWLQDIRARRLVLLMLLVLLIWMCRGRWWRRSLTWRWGTAVLHDLQVLNCRHLDIPTGNSLVRCREEDCCMSASCSSALDNNATPMHTVAQRQMRSWREGFDNTIDNNSVLELHPDGQTNDRLHRRVRW